MELGTLVPTHCTGELRVPSDTIREWAQKAEDAGFAGLWALSHPVEPPIYNTAMFDPLTVLSHVAGVTEEIPLGTSVLLLSMRRPANVVSMATSLRHLADRPVTLGVGAGNNPKEFEVTGVPMEERGPRLTEGIEILNALFEGEASYQGRFTSFENVRVDPVLDDPPRILAGGTSKVVDGERRFPDPVLDRILETDGWIISPTPPEQMATELELVREYAANEGVDPDTLRFVELQYTHVVDDDPDVIEDEQAETFREFYGPNRGFEHAQENCLVGSIEEIREQLAAYEDLGIDEVIVGPAAHDPAALDRQMELISERLLPQFS